MMGPMTGMMLRKQANMMASPMSPPALAASMFPPSLRLFRVFDVDLVFGVLEHSIDVWVHLVELDHVGHVVLLVDVGAPMSPVAGALCC